MLGLVVAMQMAFEINRPDEISHEDYINNQWQEYFIDSGCSPRMNIRENAVIYCHNVNFDKSKAPKENIKLNRIEQISFNNIKGFDYNVFDEINSFGSIRVEYSEINNLSFLINKELNGLYYIFAFNYKLRDLSFFDKLNFNKMPRINIFSYYQDQNDKEGLYNIPDSSGLFCYYNRHNKILGFYNNVGIRC